MRGRDRAKMFLRSEWSCAVAIGRKCFCGVNGRARSRSGEKSFYGVNGRVQSLSSEKVFTE